MNDIETIQERFLILVALTFPPTLSSRWKILEGKTGIAASVWRDCFSGKQRPRCDMIEAICKLHPSYALWLVFGKIKVAEQTTPSKQAIDFYHKYKKFQEGNKEQKQQFKDIVESLDVSRL